MALTATEEWVCERIQLKHDNLEDVRSLTLPGTYQHKLDHLGHSLRNFLRLKQLDLSRNCLASLDGLENLKVLERLNLYYNNVSTLDELHKLRHNSKLEDLDLRLNPVTREEPDYRLFLIHMLPSLKKLDDRGVRDSERRAALMHFGSSQASEFNDPAPRQPTPEKKSNPRVDMVKNMKKSSVLDDDDVAVLDLIARTGGDLNQPRTVTGSTASRPGMEEYSPAAVHQMESEEAGDYLPKSARSTYSNHTQQNDLPPSVAENYPQISEAYHIQSRSSSRPASEVGTPRRDANLKYQDEMDAYTSYKAHGTFTPHPGAPHPGAGEGQTDGKNQEDKAHQASQSNVNQKIQFSSSQPSNNDDQFPFLPKLLDLVDKYWNGSKSLHRNRRFKSQTDAIFSEFLESNPLSTEVAKAREEVKKLAQENLHLREKLSTASQEQAQRARTRSDTEQVQNDMEILQQKLKQTSDENRSLRQKLDYSETLLAGGGLHATGVSSGSGDRSQSDELHRQNNILKQEVDTLKIRLKQFGQMQELASMLQESHKSLVQTNEHLLKEIDDNRQRHESEVQQLHWSFDQMKKTAAMISNGGSGAPSVNGSL